MLTMRMNAIALVFEDVGVCHGVAEFPDPVTRSKGFGLGTRSNACQVEQHVGGTG